MESFDSQLDRHIVQHTDGARQSYAGIFAIPAMGATTHASPWVRTGHRTILQLAKPLEVPLHPQEAILELMERNNRDNAGQSHHGDYIHYAYQNRIHSLQAQSPDHG
jgi:hypothetical protein